MPLRRLSIVTPCFNEEAGIEACHAAVRRVMESLLTYARRFPHVIEKERINFR